MLGPIMMGIRAHTLNFIEKKLLSHPHIGSVILFARNYEHTRQLKDLITSIQAVRLKASQSPLLIAIDHEGGGVQRLLGEKFTSLPAAQTIGSLYDIDKTRALALVKAVATVTAFELGSLGIDLCLAPVLDLSPTKNKTSSRRYSHDAEHVREIAQCYIENIEQHGLSCAAKHFPGSGNVTTDTHFSVSISPASADDLLNKCMKPYEHLSKARLLKALLLSHRIYLSIDDKPPAVSKKWLQDILSKHLQFDGVIMTDCLQMTAAMKMGKTLTERIHNALSSGCHLVLCSHICDGAHSEFYAALTDPAIDSLIQQRLAPAIEKLDGLKRQFDDTYYQAGLRSPEYLDSVALIKSEATKVQEIKISFIKVWRQQIMKYLKKNPWLRKMKRSKVFYYLSYVVKMKAAIQTYYLINCKFRRKKDF